MGSSWFIYGNSCLRTASTKCLIKRQECGVYFAFVVSLHPKELNMDNNIKKYPKEEETSNLCITSEPVAALAEQETFVLSDDVGYADVVEDILQMTPDIEEEIAAADRGKTVQMDEFKTMFAKWLG